jgi:hypothetical protein
MKRLIELFCGRGGWSKAAATLGWETIGIDIEDHGYPGQLIIKKLPMTWAELQALKPTAIIASPPCEDFARRHLPWINQQGPLDERLLRWAVSLTTQRDIPVTVECSRFAGWHVPGSRWHRPYCFWGYTPILMPTSHHKKDTIRGSSGQTTKVRAARAAEIPPELAGWIMQGLDNLTTAEHPLNTSVATARFSPPEPRTKAGRSVRGDTRTREPATPPDRKSSASRR